MKPSDPNPLPANPPDPNKKYDTLEQTLAKMNTATSASGVSYRIGMRPTGLRPLLTRAVFPFLEKPQSDSSVARQMDAVALRMKLKKNCTEEQVMNGQTWGAVQSKLVESDHGKGCHYRLVVDERNRWLVFCYAENEDKWRKAWGVGDYAN
jgi:hypothetical protein